MPAVTTRQAALEQINKVFQSAVERFIPADESKPLRGTTFRDFELQVQAFKADVIPIILEQRAALTDSAEATEAGCCPHCGSQQTRWAGGPAQKEIRGPDGVIVLTKQHGRCRQCGRSFSPSGS
jgi:hypothetical protein